MRCNNYITISHLELQFPDVLKRIQVFWGNPEVFNSYINELFIDSRGSRLGFTSGAISELFMLKQLHDEIFPSNKSQWASGNSAWDIF